MTPTNHQSLDPSTIHTFDPVVDSARNSDPVFNSGSGSGSESDVRSVCAPPMMPRLGVRFRRAVRSERGAVSIEYVIVAIALLAIAASIAAALDVLAADAVDQLPASVSDVD